MLIRKIYTFASHSDNLTAGIFSQKLINMVISRFVFFFWNSNILFCWKTIERLGHYKESYYGSILGRKNGGCNIERRSFKKC